MTEATERREWHLPVSEPDKASVLLAQASGLSQTRIKRVMQAGAVWLESPQGVRRLRRAATSVKAGSTLHLYYDPAIIDAPVPAATLIADEGEYSVWYKPGGMLSQGSRWGDQATLYRWAEQHLSPQRTAHIVHRLDRAAQGLMLLAHSKQAARALSALFRSRAITKQYRVQVYGELSADSLPRWLDQDLDGRAARSLIEAGDQPSLPGQTALLVTLDSGRKHQIRRHLANIGHPVVGDRLYGGGDDSADLQLEACRLAFVCPLTGVRREYRQDGDRQS